MYDQRHRKSAIAIACAGAFVAFLDTTIVNIAFPDISSSFAGSGRDALSWVLDGYFVVIAALLVPAGGLADRFGHKRIFLYGLAGFTAYLDLNSNSTYEANEPNAATDANGNFTIPGVASGNYTNIRTSSLISATSNGDIV